MSQGSFLRIRQRALRLGYAVNLLSINYTDNEFQFLTKSETTPGVIWTQRIQLQKKLRPEEVARMDNREIQLRVLDGQLKVWCDCPAFTFWGFAYKAWMRGYGLVRETRRPIVRNPKEQGFVCFVKGTKVLTDNGEVNIEDLKVGDYVYTHKGRLKRVTTTMSRTVDKLISIEVDGKIIVTTENHPFFAYQNDTKSVMTKDLKPHKVDWVSAYKLKAKDMLLSPVLRPFDSDGIHIERSKAFLAGLYAADGTMCYKRKVNSCSVGNSVIRCKGLYISMDHRYLELYDAIFKEYGIKYSYKRDNKSNTGTIQILSNELKQFCLDTCNFTSAEFNQQKVISNDVLKWDSEAKLEFLKGFFLGDGTIVEGSGSTGNFCAYLTLFNTNQQMINKLFLLSREFFNCKLNSYNRKSFISFQGYFTTPRTMYYIRFTGESARRFSEILGESILKCKKGYTKDIKYSSYKTYYHVINDTTYLPKTIKSTKTIERVETVYNISVEDDESYLVNGFAVHNCKHLYAIMNSWKFYAPMIADKYKTWYDRNTK